MIVLLIFGRIK